MIHGPQSRRAVAPTNALWLVLALALGAVLRFWDVSGASLYSDEAFTFAVSGLPLTALLHMLAAHDFHPPLFYVATHYLMLWLKWPLADYRFFTACAGLVTVAATWGFARRCFGALGGAVAALTVALEPALLQYDRLYRMHAIGVALCCLSWWLLSEIEVASRKKRPWLWVAYALIAIVLPYVDYLGILVLVTQVIFALRGARTHGLVLLCAGLSALAFIPWLPELRAQFSLGGFTISRPLLDSGLLASIRGAFAVGTPDRILELPHFDGAFVLLIVAVGAGGIWQARRCGLPYWLGLLPLQIVLSLWLGKNLAYFPRYLLMTVPAVAIAVAGLIAMLVVHGRRIVAILSAATLLAFLAAGASNLLFNAYYQFPDWYAVDALLQAHAQPADGIILDAGYEYLVVRNYRAFRNHPVLVFMNPGDFAPVFRWLARNPGRRVWYIEHQNFYYDPHKKIASRLGAGRKVLLNWTQARQSPVDAVTVALFDRIPMIKSR